MAGLITKRLSLWAIGISLIITICTGLLSIRENEEVTAALPNAIILGHFEASTGKSTTNCGSAFPYETINRGLPSPFLQSYGELPVNSCRYTGTNSASVVSFVVDWLIFSVFLLLLMAVARFFS